MSYRTKYDNDDYWMKEFERNLHKSAVQSKQQDDSIFNQITSIMNGTKSKFSSVADVVAEMKERAGMNAYHEKIKLSEQNTNKKTAQVEPVKSSPNDPQIFKQNPSVRNTIQNFITATKGNMPIPAILDKVMSIHKNDVADQGVWEDSNLLRFISQANLKAKSLNPIHFQQNNNLGMSNENDEISPENSDAFHHLMPSSDY